MRRADWSGVHELVARLAAAPEAANVFGAHGHEWLLEPPLTAAELAAVEAQLRVELPGEYRSFLVEVGRGGAGPGYGLFSLRRVDGRWRWEGDGAQLTCLETLAEPFPHVEAFNPFDELPAQPYVKDYDSLEEFSAADDAWWKLYNSDPPVAGLLYLAHGGCSSWETLVVSGPARGQMWADDTGADGGLQPLHDDEGQPLGFARWYLRWLDGAAAQLSSGLHP
ncbi:SMI1/KNR4 family protein [Frankia nepalensis]|uniref:SMI1/KNR4 family protein n=1 Tax=Frankia nepalensis TaxID=1836974 RepID=A0A937US22_9ACTN|nr:SMI1/KNR4 family protein [Frankia nepalensis]MBL7629820.1 SMI1/KNR4 family protein [Frankia nepalensis]